MYFRIYKIDRLHRGFYSVLPDFTIESGVSLSAAETIIARTVQRQWFSACSPIFKAVNKGLWQITRSVRVNVSIYEIRGYTNSASSISLVFYNYRIEFRKLLINFLDMLSVHIKQKPQEEYL